MSTSLFNWNSKIEQLSTGFDVTSNENDNYASYDDSSVASDIKTQALPSSDTVSRDSGNDNSDLVNYLNSLGVRNRNDLDRILNTKSPDYHSKYNVTESSVPKTKKTIDFVKKTHKKCWKIHAIVRILAVAIFIYMVYRYTRNTDSTAQLDMTLPDTTSGF